LQVGPEDVAAPMSHVGSKQELRALLGQRRNAEKERAAKSAAIAGKIIALQQIESAKVICCYVSFRSEVETRDLIRQLLQQDKSVVVPWCKGDELRLTRIESMNDLAPRTLGLLEPVQSIREDSDRQVSPVDVEVFLVPGLAFTPAGDRLGYGRGYYDRTLAQCPDSWKIGVAFDVQIVEAIPVNRLDIRMNSVVTESHVFSG
jgi:5-formyltetrahydrofolate cyclo-ligase